MIPLAVLLIGVVLWWSSDKGPITGTVVDVHGAPVPGVRIHLEREYGEEMFPESMRWVAIREPSAVTGKNGDFFLEDPGRGGRYRLTADEDDHVLAWKEIERGQTDVQVTLEPGWLIHGSLVIDEELDLEACMVKVLHPAADPRDRGFEAIGFQERYDFAVGQLPPLRLTGHGLEDPFLPTAVMTQAGQQVGWDSFGEVTIYFPEDSLDLQVQVSGYRDVLMEGVQGDRDVPVVPGYPVEVFFGEIPGFPEDVMEMIELRAVAKDSGAVGSPRNVPFFYNGDSVPAPGDYKIMVQLMEFSTEEDSGHVPMPFTYVTTLEEAPVITVEDKEGFQTFHIPIDQTVVWQAIHRLRRLDWPGRDEGIRKTPSARRSLPAAQHPPPLPRAVGSQHPARSVLRRAFPSGRRRRYW